MTKEEIQDKLDFILNYYNTIVRANGYKAGSGIKEVFFFDLVHMLNKALEVNDGTQQSDIGEVTDQTGSGTGSL